MFALGMADRRPAESRPQEAQTMRLHDIHHIAIKTLDLEKTNRFYTEVLGMSMAHRPPFDFPGSWLNIGNTMVHLMAGKAAYDKNGRFLPGSAAVDHISINAEGYEAYRDRFREHGLDWREFDIPAAGIRQLFVKDPNGVLIELTFAVAAEPPGGKGYDESRRYNPGQF
jgi:catechol 2,3-dioxygenase-like lactoylglutathione lyase family enzyme